MGYDLRNNRSTSSARSAKHNLVYNCERLRKLVSRIKYKSPFRTPALIILSVVLQLLLLQKHQNIRFE